MGVAGAGAGTFGIQPLEGAFGVQYRAAVPRDERLHPGPTEKLHRNVAGWSLRSRRRVGKGDEDPPREDSLRLCIGIKLRAKVGHARPAHPLQHHVARAGPVQYVV